jgi:hypothetical protein
MSRIALENIALRAGRNADHGKGLAAVERLACFGEVWRGPPR